MELYQCKEKILFSTYSVHKVTRMCIHNSLFVHLTQITTRDLKCDFGNHVFCWRDAVGASGNVHFGAIVTMLQHAHLRGFCFLSDL